MLKKGSLLIKIKYRKKVLEEEIIGLINAPDHVYDIKDGIS